MAGFTEDNAGETLHEQTLGQNSLKCDICTYDTYIHVCPTKKDKLPFASLEKGKVDGHTYSHVLRMYIQWYNQLGRDVRYMHCTTLHTV